MTLHINEAEVRAVLTMPMVVEAVEEIRASRPPVRSSLTRAGGSNYPAAVFFTTWPRRISPWASLP